MKRLTESEANKLLTELIRLRKKYQKYRSKNNLEAYQNYEAKCAAKFDYLVISKTNKYKKFANHTDLQQEGRLALLHALRNFDITKGSFFWWADKYIKTKISREANRHSTIKIPLKHAYDMQPYKVSEMPTLIDTNKNALETLEADEIINKVNLAIEQLPENQRQILKLNGIKSYSISKISKELNVPRPSCIKLLNEAKETLKNHLKD